MNRPPDAFVRLPAATLRPWVAGALMRCGKPPELAGLLAELLVASDLRGVFSHGTQQVSAYVDHFRAGRLTPAPEVRVVEESPATLLVDGGGGLGYFPAHRAAGLLAAKALEVGVAAAVTRNHGHIGAAGVYARLPQAHGLITWVTSGHQLDLQPGQTLLAAAGGSPMAFALPTGAEPPFVLDFGAMHDMYPGSPHVEQLIALAPGSVFRSLGLGAVCQALGGFLAGVPLDAERAERRWSGANQGSLMVCVDPRRFFPLEQFQAEMDAYARRVQELEPLPGHAPAALAGGMEWQREREYREHGIPIGPAHAERLRAVAALLEIESPV